MKIIFTTIIIYLLTSTQISCFDYVKIQTPPISILNQETSTVNQHSRVAELTTGNYVLVWHAKIPSQSTYFNVLFNVYDSTQNKSTQNYVKASTATNNQSIYPDTCSDSNGGFVIIWEDTDQSSYSKVFLRHYDSNLNASTIINVKEYSSGILFLIYLLITAFTSPLNTPSNIFSLFIPVKHKIVINVL
jgi:hypothetical protein